MNNTGLSYDSQLETFLPLTITVIFHYASGNEVISFWFAFPYSEGVYFSHICWPFVCVLWTMDT